MRASFAAHQVPVPVISTIRVGRLPAGSRVVLESMAESQRTQNPSGLAFISGQATQAPLDPLRGALPVVPLAEKSIASLKSALEANSLGSQDVLRVTCFTSSLEDYAAVRAKVAETFSRAALNFVQVQSKPENQVVECEAVARLKTTPAEPVLLVNPTGAAFAQAVLVTVPRILLTTTEPGAGSNDAAVRQSFTRLKEILDAAGSSLDRVFYAYAYPASAAALQAYRDHRWEFLDKSHPPASTNLPFDGPASPSALIGIDVMALPK